MYNLFKKFTCLYTFLYLYVINIIYKHKYLIYKYMFLLQMIHACESVLLYLHNYFIQYKRIYCVNKNVYCAND